MRRILVIEDEARIAELVGRGLEAAGFDVRIVDDGVRGLAAALDPTVALLVLDLALPRLSGEEILAELAEERSDLPVLILSASGEVDDRIRGLEAGAHDYLPKPFAVSELVARVRARLRERTGAVGRWEHGRIVLDAGRRIAETAGRRVELTERENELLLAFLRHPSQVRTAEQLQLEVWGGDEGRSNLVEAYVARLRRKLGHDTIETVRGAGYRFVG